MKTHQTYQPIGGPAGQPKLPKLLYVMHLTIPLIPAFHHRLPIVRTLTNLSLSNAQEGLFPSRATRGHLTDMKQTRLAEALFGPAGETTGADTNRHPELSLLLQGLLSTLTIVLAKSRQVELTDSTVLQERNLPNKRSQPSKCRAGRIS